jgi:hypothetical protein
MRCVTEAKCGAFVAARAAALLCILLAPIALTFDLIQSQFVLPNRMLVLLYEHMIGCRASEATSTPSLEQEIA